MESPLGGARVRLVFGLLLLAPLAGCTSSENGGDGGEDGGDEDLTLILGTMMPLTGGLNNLGPDMERSAKLAIRQVNDADAGLTIEAYHEDDKTSDSSGAPNTFNLLASRDVTAIAGPCCSGVTGSILDLAVENEVVVSSPSATSPSLTLERENDGFFWRVPPSDAVQGKVLAGLVGDEDVLTVSMILINNPYGNGLAKVFKQQFTTSLSGVVLKEERYAEGATSFSGQVDAVCATPRPDAIVMVAYIDEGAAIVRELQAKGCLDGMRLFGSEGIYDPGYADKAGTDEGGNCLAAGTLGTTPEAGDVDAFATMFEDAYDHAPGLYSAESYDAVMYVALAALAAGSTEGRDIADNLLAIANPPGTKVSTFAEAAEMLADGGDIDWVGQAHDFEFDENHEPVTGIYSYWRVTDECVVEIYETGKSA